ncbi:lipid asymmetry maintenance protein MlaB [Lysobacter korlensis]|uniref:Lipid asymmetry maintenance protein MlaB n=1 Tax=Lysobacter korlensis TaxID=553636 RepID=A0ABV6RSH8_9GAMM
MTQSGTATEPDRLALRLEGDLTIARAAEVKPELLAALTGPLDVDLSGVTVIDGAGLQLLIMLGREAQRRNVPVRWHSPSRAVRSALTLVRLGGDFDMADTAVPATGAEVTL